MPVSRQARYFRESRENWKIQQFQIQTVAEEDCLRAKGHHYQVQTIQLAVEQVIGTGHSYRGVATTMELFSQNCLTESPQRTQHQKMVGKNWVI